MKYLINRSLLVLAFLGAIIYPGAVISNQEKPYEEITVQQLKELMDQEGERLLIIDAQPFIHYRDGHIPGALNFEFPHGLMVSWDENLTKGRTEEDFQKLLGPDYQRPVVFYCFGTICNRSHNGALWAHKLGYQRVYRLPGGFTAWRQTKNPVEKTE